MADKLLITSAFITLTYLKVIPFWITAVVVSRDLMLSVGVLVIHVAGGTVHPTPSWLGKASTLFQMGTVLSAMLAFYFKMLMSLPKGGGLGHRVLHRRLRAPVPRAGAQAAQPAGRGSLADRLAVANLEHDQLR